MLFPIKVFHLELEKLVFFQCLGANDKQLPVPADWHLAGYLFI